MPSETNNRILKIHKSSIKEISGAYLRQTRAGGWMTTLLQLRGEAQLVILDWASRTVYACVRQTKVGSQCTAQVAQLGALQ